MCRYSTVDLDLVHVHMYNKVDHDVRPLIFVDVVWKGDSIASMKSTCVPYLGWPTTTYMYVDLRGI